MLFALADIAGVYPVFRKGLCGLSVFLKDAMSVKMKVADDGRVVSFISQHFDNFRGGLGGFIIIDGPAHHLRSGFNKKLCLRECFRDIRGRRVRHGLDNDRVLTADGDIAYMDSWGFSTVHHGHLL